MQLSNMPPAAAPDPTYAPVFDDIQQAQRMMRQAAGMPISERCVPEFEMQASTMDTQIEELHKFVEALEMKLTPVLKPYTSTQGNGVDVQKTDPAVAPIAAYLRSKNYDLRSVLDSLSTLLHDRIDL